jgi:hypothetical protein
MKVSPIKDTTTGTSLYSVPTPKSSSLSVAARKEVAGTETPNAQPTHS